MSNGPLSPPARLCLLAWDPARPGATATARIQHLVRAGALTELARRGLLTDDEGIATPVDLDSRTGDAVLDGLLDLVRESLPHRWRTWVRLHARVTYDAVREQLVAEGYLRAEKKRVLGVFPSVEYVLARVAVAQALREETRYVLQGPVPVGEVSERDAAVAALAAAAGLRALGPPGTGARREGRVAELTERGGAAAPGLRRIVGEVWGTVSAETARAVASAGG
ncbi:GOLPH3/VPS74 family protein [Streptomyces lancefieldiae]|uniref:GPP34 family phosphoprotein n=1 Tax=Streptomyces lancefieldiae TaxID=3075520 RepID=A0ABU3AEZ5_9ACTN|nr:GPP34 family phosphoprotein [Streptomyces sp. DSM 40712]MDT0608754.1 GPP34 family phosphoprotein [Streptomyces sp. DSM 40712]